MGLLICKKYGKVLEENCAKCKDRKGASCPNFIMIASNAQLYGSIRRTESRDAEGKATLDVTVVDEKAEELISERVESRRTEEQRRKIKARRLI